MLVDLKLNRLKFRLNGKEVSFDMCKSIKQLKKMSVFSIVNIFYKNERDVPFKDRSTVETMAGGVELEIKGVSTSKVDG